jgi:hypothetical protein
MYSRQEYTEVSEEINTSSFSIEDMLSKLAVCSLLAEYIVTYMCDYRRGLDWWMDLLTTYTQDSELQAITEPPLISTIHKSPQQPLSLSQPCVLTSRSLATASNI